MNYFDFCIAESSFDHDGLGRYGDPINPDGDLLAMHQARKVLKNHGKTIHLSIFNINVST